MDRATDSGGPELAHFFRALLAYRGLTDASDEHVSHAYLLTDRFPRLIAISVAIGALTSFFGAYASFFLDGATGGIIVVLQTLIFLAVFAFAPKHGLLAARRRARQALEAGA